MTHNTSGSNTQPPIKAYSATRNHLLSRKQAVGLDLSVGDHSSGQASPVRADRRRLGHISFVNWIVISPATSNTTIAEY